MNKEEKLKVEVLNKIKSKFKLQKCNIKDLESFSYPKYIKILKFSVEQYKVRNLGNMCILEGKSILGLSIFTVVFTPYVNYDIPFVIIDFMQMRNKLTVFVEFYNEHMKNKDYIKILDNKLRHKKDKYKCIENYIEKGNWYVDLRNKYSPLKKGNKENKEALITMVLDYLDEYLNFVDSIDEKYEDVKNKDLEKFIEDLIIKGNPSSKILKKSLGEEGYDKFCREIIFNNKR